MPFNLLVYVHFLAEPPLVAVHWLRRILHSCGEPGKGQILRLLWSYDSIEWLDTMIPSALEGFLPVFWFLGNDIVRINPVLMVRGSADGCYNTTRTIQMEAILHA